MIFVHVRSGPLTTSLERLLARNLLAACSLVTHTSHEAHREVVLLFRDAKVYRSWQFTLGVDLEKFIISRRSANNKVMGCEGAVKAPHNELELGSIARLRARYWATQSKLGGDNLNILFTDIIEVPRLPRGILSLILRCTGSQSFLNLLQVRAELRVEFVGATLFHPRSREGLKRLLSKVGNDTGSHRHAKDSRDRAKHRHDSHTEVCHSSKVVWLFLSNFLI
mmetsp:Transcript_2690/g.6311  ORF Transcript_2690/g.6311 Transcript_2690/m.6311 type:complete len:223 (-) Transcript_2690:1076-1744(-)